MTTISLLPLFLLPFGNLFDLPFANISASAFIGIIYLLYAYPYTFLRSFSLVLFISLLAIAFNLDYILFIRWPRIVFSSLYWAPFVFPLFGFSSRPIPAVNLLFLYRYFLSFASLLSLIAIISFFYDPSIRPELTFNEPSWFALFLASILFANVQFSSAFRGVRQGLTTIILFLALLLTASTQVFILPFSFIIVYIRPLLSKQFRYIMMFRTVLSWRILVLIIAVPLSLSVLIPLLPIHLSSRLTPVLYSLSTLDFYVDTSLYDGSGDISAISYLNGLLQAISALAISPLIGVGAGMTGHFQQLYSVTSNYFEATLLNFNDSYSLLFRGLIEFGMLFVFILAKWIMHIFHIIDIAQPIRKYFLHVSLCLLVGSLLKHPILPSSLVFCAFYIPIIFTSRPSHRSVS